MSKMNNFYQLFEVLDSASSKEILMAYENKITKYNNLKSLSEQDVYDIKMLKIGVHILLDSKLRKKYDLTTGITKKKIDLDDLNSELQTILTQAQTQEYLTKKQTGGKRNTRKLPKNLVVKN